jgi:Flp pilus assembly protein TadG
LEFAIVFPVLVMLVFGMFTGGLVMNRRLSTSHAAREAARYGATVPEGQCTPTSNCGGRSWAQQVQNVAVSRAGGDVAVGDVCVALVEGSGAAPAAIDATHTTAGGTSPCYVDNSADEGERVQVQITFSDSIDAIFVNVPVNATLRSTARFEQ